MRSERAFITFRVAGDKLVPEDVTKLLGLKPTLEYAKGARYRRAPNGPELTGRTGVWYFSTDMFMGKPLEHHIGYLLDRFAGKEKLEQFKKFLRENSLHAILTCFWAGPPTQKAPIIPDRLRDFLKSIPVDLETDFDNDMDETPPREGREMNRFGP